MWRLKVSVMHFENKDEKELWIKVLLIEMESKPRPLHPEEQADSAVSLLRARVHGPRDYHLGAPVRSRSDAEF